MAPAEDGVEESGRAGIAGQIAGLVEDEKVRLNVASEPAVECGKSLLLEEVGERHGQRREADAAAGIDGGEAQVLGAAGADAARLREIRATTAVARGTAQRPGTSTDDAAWVSFFLKRRCSTRWSSAIGRTFEAKAGIHRSNYTCS
jgi:hypothetical protein